MSFSKRQKTSRITRVILPIGFIFLLGRLIYVVSEAIQQQQQKKRSPAIPAQVVKEE